MAKNELVKQKKMLKIHVLGSAASQIEAEVSAMQNGKFILTFEELCRIAREVGIPFPEFVTQDRFQDDGWGSGHSIAKVVRHSCVYKTTVNGLIATGAGSAGADNVGSQIRSYAYEMAHKRGQARCLKMALGIMDALADIELDEDSFVYKEQVDITEATKQHQEATKDMHLEFNFESPINQNPCSEIPYNDYGPANFKLSDPEEDHLPEFAAPMEKIEKPASIMQAKAVFNILANAIGQKGVAILTTDEICTAFQKLNFGTLAAKVSAIEKEYHKDSLDKFAELFTKSELADFIIDAGNVTSSLPNYKTTDAIEFKAEVKPEPVPDDPFGDVLSIFESAQAQG